MTENTNWLFLRETLTQSPTNPATGNDVGASPDIITVTSVATITQMKAWQNDYNQNVSSPVDYSHDTYVYARCKNFTNTKISAQVSLYVTFLNNVTSQGSWRSLQILQKPGNFATKTTTWVSPIAGQVGVTNEAFVFPASSAPTQNNALVLIAVLTDADHDEPTIPEDVTTIDAFKTWVASQPAIAILELQPPAPAETSQSLSWTSNFAINNREAEDLSFVITTSKVSSSAQVSFTLSSSDNQGQLIGIGKTPVQTGNGVQAQATVDKNFRSSVTVTFSFADDQTDIGSEFNFQVVKPHEDIIGTDTTLVEFNVSLQQSKVNHP